MLPIFSGNPNEINSPNKKKLAVIFLEGGGITLHLLNVWRREDTFKQ